MRAFTGSGVPAPETVGRAEGGRERNRSHADIRGILLPTADEEIVENTGTDRYWGRGRTGTGKNMLGRILMRTLKHLRTEAQGSHHGIG